MHTHYSTDTFTHPAPERKHTRIWPVFLPFAGCPFRCIYCAQPALTGQTQSPLEPLYDNLGAGLNNALKKSTKSLELAFFGGTFTALPIEWQERFLRLASAFRDKGLITRIRCSTRPDCFTKSSLKHLKALGLDLVELGIQTFDENALQDSKRGYSPNAAQNACETVREAGLDLGIQLMPGIPGQTPEAFSRDITTACAMRPLVARLYPCVVLKDTGLAKRYAEGRYQPWTIEETIPAVGAGLLKLWQAGVTVIRIGLAPEQDLQDAIIKGPWHPAMGQLVRSEALFLYIQERRNALGAERVSLACPERYRSDLLGHKHSMVSRYEHIGLPLQNISFTNDETFTLTPSAPA